MLLIDDREGSAELEPLLRAAGLECSLTRLEAGDIALIGNGPHGLVNLLVEYKTVADVLNCIVTKRFADHQLPGLAQSDMSWLLVEGVCRSDSSGALIVNGAKPIGRQWAYSALANWLNTVSICGGVRIVQTAGRLETVAWLKAWTDWWAQPFETHDAHRGLMDPLALVTQFQSPTYVQRLAALLPGIGLRKSLLVAQRFGNIRTLVNAAPSEWAEIDGIGKTIVSRVQRALREMR